MKILRIIISLILVGAAGLMMNQDLRKSHFLEIELSLGDFRASKIEAWHLERSWEVWIEKQLDKKGYAYSQSGKAYVLEGKLEVEKDLEQLLSIWNQNESERAKLEQLEIESKQNKLLREIKELKLQAESLDALLMRLATITLESVEVPSFDFEQKNKVPKVKTSSIKSVELKSSDLQKQKSKQVVEGPSELDSLEASIESMKNVIQTQLTGLESNLSELDKSALERDSQLLSEIRNARIEEGKMANESLKLIYTELQSFQKSLSQDLNQMADFFFQIDRHQTGLWYHEKNLLMERLGLKRASLSRKIDSMSQQNPAQVTQPLYAKVDSQKLVLSQKQIAESFRILLAGFLVCLLFNLIWEAILQRRSF